MIVQSRLPQTVGELDPTWHAGLDDDYMGQASLVLNPQLSELRPLKPREDGWIERYTGVINLIRFVDMDFRRRTGIADDQAMMHDVDLRAGKGNFTALHQRVLTVSSRYRENLKRLAPSVLHADVRSAEEVDEARHQIGTMYTVVDSEDPDDSTTEWYPGWFWLPNKHRRGFYPQRAVIATSVQARLKRPYQAPVNSLLFGKITDVHRMPPVDLTKGNRWFFRDYVYTKKIDS